jgi:uncharacterized protein YbjT (DUF2867 family)
MKFVVTGSLGNISKPLTEQLVKSGHEVTLISSKPEKTAEIEALGAKAAIGSVEDLNFLTQTFTGADAVYTMVPPDLSVADWKGHIHSIGKNYTHALKASGVKKVVNLSSVGAHMAEGCGPVSGLYRVEQELNQLEGVDIKHLRPAYFYYNLCSNIPLIKHMGIAGGNYGEGANMVMVHPRDIAMVAAEELLNPGFTGKSVRYIAGDERSTTAIAKALGEAIGKPGLPWVNFKNEDAYNGMLRAGLSAEIANNYVEMGSAIASGEMASDYHNHKPILSPTKLEDFAKEFAVIFANS